MERRNQNSFCLILLLCISFLAANADLINPGSGTPIQSLAPKGSTGQCLKMSGSTVTWGSCGSGGGGGLSNVTINNGDSFLSIVNGALATNGTTIISFNEATFLQNGNNLSDLDSASTSRTNLGVAIGSDVQAYSANLANWAVNNGSEVQALTSAGFTIKTSSGSDNLVLGASGSPTATAYGGWNFDAATANTIASFGASKTLTSLATSTYPSLTELSYVKGVTSAIQTQFSNKQPLDSDLTAIAALSFAANGDLITTSGGSIIRLAKGSDNQVLTMNGNLLGWETPSGGGSSKWTDGGTYLYPVSLEEISVGTSTHNGALHVARSTNGYMAWYHNTKKLSDLVFNYRGVNSVSEIFDVMHTIDRNGTALMSYGYDGGKNSFIVSDNGNFANGRFLIGMDGNVGINSNSTIAQLTMNGTSVIAMKPVTAPAYSSGWGKVYIKSSTGNLTFLKDEMMSGTEYDLIPSANGVEGPGSSTDTAIALWDGTSGTLVQDSVVLISSMGDITGAGSLSISGGMSNPLVVSTSKLVVDSSGNVGINDSSPSYQLDVNGLSRFTDHLSLSNNKYISFADSGAMGDNTVLGVDSSNNVVLKSFDLMMGGSAPIIFKSEPSAGESMRLDTNGYLGINTTGPNTYSHIYANNTDTTTTLARFEQDSTGDASVTFTLTSTENWAMGIDNSDSDKFKISRSEDLGTDPKLVISGSDITITNNGAFNQSAYFDAEVDDGNSSTADTIDWRTGNHHKSTMTGNCTYTFTAPAGATTLTLKLVQDGTGSRLATWPASVKWPGNTDPTLSTGSADIDFVSCYYDGTNYYCQFGANFE